jgi:uncharacterized RDD family membrane protein YckC
MSGNQPPGNGNPQGGQGDQNPYEKNPPPYPGSNPYGPPPSYPTSPDPAHGQNPYGQPEFGQAPPVGGGGMPPLATSGQRFLARLIDLGIFVVLFIVLWVALGVSASDTGSLLLLELLVGGGAFLYEGLMLSGTGQTVGKKVMSIRVARLADGAAPGNAAWVRAAVYSFIGVVPCVGFILSLVNVLWHLWDKPYRQCWHDKAAKTVVVRA